MKRISAIRWVVLLMLICPLCLFGQTEAYVKADLDSLRAGGDMTHNYDFNSSNERPILSMLRQYEKDANKRVRLHVRRVRAMITDKSSDTLVRQQVVESFLEDCLTSDYEVYLFSTGMLQRYKQQDFSPRARQLITVVFKKGSYDRTFLLVCGEAQVKQLIPPLKKMAAGFNRAEEGWYRTPAWFASLALTRMGDAEKVDAIISAVELELNPTIRVSVLLQNIAYTRHPECIKLLQKYLDSTGRLPALVESRDPLAKEALGIPYNQYAIKYLAQYLEGFPVKYKVAGYTDEELQLARDYLKNRWQKK